MNLIEPLVETKWLEEHLYDPDLRIIDATVQVKLWPFPRVISGKRNFKRRHIPGAAFADLLKILSSFAFLHKVVSYFSKEFYH
jgi:thiosulfate/3-mercaptopyruvate sulfurtransferase